MSCTLNMSLHDCCDINFRNLNSEQVVNWSISKACLDDYHDEYHSMASLSQLERNEIDAPPDGSCSPIEAQDELTLHLQKARRKFSLSQNVNNNSCSPEKAPVLLKTETVSPDDIPLPPPSLEFSQGSLMNYINASERLHAKKPWLKMTPLFSDFENECLVVVQNLSQTQPQTVWVTPKAKEGDNLRFLYETNLILKKQPPLLVDRTNIDDLVVIKEDEIYFRAVVLSFPDDSGVVDLRLLDYGVDLNRRTNELFMPLEIMKDTPNFTTPVHLTMKDFELKAEIKIYVLDWNSNGMPIVASDISTVQTYEKATKQIVRLQESDDDCFINLNDIPLVPLQLFHHAKVMCLDNTYLNDGYITVYTHPRNGHEFVEFRMAPEITVYCKNLVANCHCPGLNEVCLVLNEQDKQWYRAVCLESNKNRNLFKMVFLFGYTKMIFVKSASIRKIPKKFLYPAAAHLCVIDGVDQHTEPERMENLRHLCQLYHFIDVEEIRYVENDIYSLTLKF